jgi:5-methyltetrahydrofolate corrinoid/iron sulfur protein methyltransferase
MIKIIGENINRMSKPLQAAMMGRNIKPIQETARAMAEQGLDYFDLNIGPAKKDGPELMKWMVQTVQEAVSLPCSLDSSNPDAIRGGLEVHKGRALINSTTLQPERIERVLPLAKEFDCDIICVLWGPSGMPRDADERAMFATEIMTRANDLGIPNERLWIDPIATPVSGDINQVKACVEMMQVLKDLVPGCNSTIGLSNVSNGTPAELRPWLNRTYLIMLMRCGLYSAILNAFDEDLLAIARGGRPDIVDVVHGAMDGTPLDLGSLSPELRSYYKTCKVLNGDILYSHSWLVD